MLIHRRQFIRAFPLGLLCLYLTACTGTMPATPAPTEDIAGVAEATATQLSIEQQTLAAQSTSTGTPASVEGLLAGGREAANRGEWALALKLYDQAISLDPSNAQAFLLRGNAYLAMGEMQKALIDFDQSINLDGSSAAAYNSRGLSFAEEGDNEKAQADFTRAVELDSGFGAAYRNRAAIYVVQGNYEAAVLDLQIYLSIAPDAPDKALVEAQIADLQGEVLPPVEDETLLFFDDFADGESGWHSNGDPAGIGEYNQGGYLVGHTQPNSAGWSLPGRIFDDTWVEVIATKIGGDDDNFFGVMCRVQGTASSASFYVLMISSDGFYGIGKRVNGGELTLIGQNQMLNSSAINQGTASNIVRAECVEDRLALYANGSKLVEVFDEELESGQIGLLAGTFEEANTEILFDNLYVYSLSE